MSGNGDGGGDAKDSLEVKVPQLAVPESAPQPAPGSAPATPTGAAANVVNTINSVRKVVAVIGIVIAALTFMVRTRVFGKGLGQGVFSAGDCRSGKMLRSEGPFAMSGICTKECVDDKECGSSLHCTQGSCVPVGTGVLGHRCSASWDCQSELCVSASSTLPAFMFQGNPEAALKASEPAHWACSQHCDDQTNPCPSGFSCVGGASDNEHFCVDDTNVRQNAASLLDLLQHRQSKE